MREIKFRGKSIYDKQWKYGYYHTWGEPGDNGLPEKYYAETLTEMHSIRNDLEDFLIFPNTIGQYTGLKDSKGNKIFEGDIAIIKSCIENITTMEFFDIVAKVIFTNGSFYFYNKGGCYEPVGNKPSSWEVFSNIHENPELLKEGE